MKSNQLFYVTFNRVFIFMVKLHFNIKSLLTA